MWSPPGPTPRRPDRRIWSNGTSRRPSPTSCGWSTSPTWRPGRAWPSPRSCPTCFSRRVVGWRTAASMPTELPLDALEMALWTRDRDGHGVGGVVHHSDAGTQYTSIRYSTRLDDAGAVASIGTVGDSVDNAMAESVIGLYKRECVRHDGPFRTVDDLELATSAGSTGSTTTASTAPSAMSPQSSSSSATTVTSTPAAAAAGRTEPPLNPGRFKDPRHRHRPPTPQPRPSTEPGSHWPPARAGAEAPRRR